MPKVSSPARPATEVSSDAVAICFPDSTVIVGDFHLQGSSFDSFEANLKANSARLIVSQAVIDEVTHHHQREFRSHLRSANDKLSRFIGMNQKRLDLEDHYSDALTNYPAILNERLKKLGAEIITVPSIEVAPLYKKALIELKPFRRSGNKDQTGFKDAVIWECLKKVVTENPGIIYFVTKNLRDFAAEDGVRLHPDLINDLESLGIIPERIRLLQDIESFRKEVFLKSIQVFENPSAVAEPLRSNLIGTLNALLRIYDFGATSLSASFGTTFLNFVKVVRIQAITRTSEEKESEISVSRSSFEFTVDLEMIAVGVPGTALNLQDTFIVETQETFSRFIFTLKIQIVTLIDTITFEVLNASISKLGRIFYVGLSEDMRFNDSFLSG